MGLDSVELVMALEETFDIVISNELAERLLTVGDAHRAILDLLAAKGTPQNPHDVYELLVRVVIERTGSAPEDVTPETRFFEDLRID